VTVARRNRRADGAPTPKPARIPFVRRPFEGLPGEADWVALREFVPAATATVRLGAGAGGHAGDEVVIATVLPLAWPALRRLDGAVYVGLQTAGASADASRDVAAALERALEAEPGSPVEPGPLPEAGSRLQDLVDPAAGFEVLVREGFEFWVEGVAQTPEVAASLERANTAVVPTVRLASVDAAYWCSIGTKEHLRWVLTEDEDALVDALARLHIAGGLALGEGTRYVGSLRADGLLIPVWDLPEGHGADALEEPAAALRARLDDALASPRALTSEERGARNGLLTRQLTLR
jgi:hypothetical protein